MRSPRTAKFLSEEIQVVSPASPKQPQEFIWQGRRHRVVTVIESWFDFGFPAGSPKRTNWRLRRHRKHFLVEADDKRLYQICWDRSAKAGKGAWLMCTTYETEAGSRAG